MSRIDLTFLSATLSFMVVDHLKPPKKAVEPIIEKAKKLVEQDYTDINKIVNKIYIDVDNTLIEPIVYKLFLSIDKNNIRENDEVDVEEDIPQDLIFSLNTIDEIKSGVKNNIGIDINDEDGNEIMQYLIKRNIVSLQELESVSSSLDTTININGGKQVVTNAVPAVELDIAQKLQELIKVLNERIRINNFNDPNSINTKNILTNKIVDIFAYLLPKIKGTPAQIIEYLLPQDLKSAAHGIMFPAWQALEGSSPYDVDNFLPKYIVHEEHKEQSPVVSEQVESIVNQEQELIAPTRPEQVLPNIEEQVTTVPIEEPAKEVIDNTEVINKFVNEIKSKNTYSTEIDYLNQYLMTTSMMVTVDKNKVKGKPNLITLVPALIKNGNVIPDKARTFYMDKTGEYIGTPGFILGKDNSNRIVQLTDYPTIRSWILNGNITIQ